MSQLEEVSTGVPDRADLHHRRAGRHQSCTERSRVGAPDPHSGDPAAGAAAPPDSQARPDGPASSPSRRPPTQRSPLYLEVFYFSAGHRRWFLGILIGLVVIAQAVTPSLYLLKGGKDLLPLLSVASYNGELITAPGLLIYSDREAVHVAVAVATLAALGYTISVGVGPIGEVGAATRGRPLGRDRSNREYPCQRVRPGYSSAGRSPASGGCG